MPRGSATRSTRVAGVAAAWLLALTLLNLASGGSLRGTILYAVPVAFAAWRGVHLGFVFAAVAALSAWAGGAIPQPGLMEPIWIEGLWAFLKLSAIAVGTRIFFHQLRSRRST
jgi:hypothetical protein